MSAHQGISPISGGGAAAALASINDTNFSTIQQTSSILDGRDQNDGTNGAGNSNNNGSQRSGDSVNISSEAHE
jgi:hypothetical protein